MPDVGLLTLTEFSQEAQRIASATQLPLLCDADTGFGEALLVERTVHLFEQAGAAGIHLEDQQMPKRCGHLSGKSLVDAEVMAAKIRAAVASRQIPISSSSPAPMPRRHPFRRCGWAQNSISTAGADGIFPEALESIRNSRRFAKQVSAPLLANMTEFGKSPLLDVKTLGQLGYKMVLFPLTAFRAAMKAAEETLVNLLMHGHQRESVPKMLTRAELDDLLGYTDYEKRDRAYFGR